MSGEPLHHPVNHAWLKRNQEAVLFPEQAILDAHHHLWDRPGQTYLCADFQRDVADGHDVRGSVYVQCRTGYRATGPVEMQPVGEVETVLKWCQGHPNHPLGLVAFADLQLGARVEPVVHALMDAGQGKVCGVRNTTAYHDDPRVRSNPMPPARGLLSTPAYLEGARVLARLNLSLDVWAYHTQLSEVVNLAAAVPELTLVVNHLGGPLGVGPYRRNDPDVFAVWQRDMTALAQLPNVNLKWGGLGLKVLGHAYALEPQPPSSVQLAKDWSPYLDVCLSAFGTHRTLFESNFPVDKGQFSYRTLWNAFKRLVQSFQPHERDQMFWRNATRCYRLSAEAFTA